MNGSLTRLLTAVAMIITLVSIGSPAQAQTADFGYVLAIQGGYGTSEVSVAIPEGTEPVSLSTTITSSYSTPGRLDVLINGRRRASVPAIGGGPVRLPLDAADVEQGSVIVGLRAALTPDTDCLRDDQATATMEDPQLVVTGRPVTPTTIADFLKPGPSSYVVAVPAAPSAAEQAAGLDAALALRYLYGETADITLVLGDPPASTRVVEVAQWEQAQNSLAVTEGVMRITGSAQNLEQAAVSLADPNIGLLAVESVSDLNGPAQYAPLDGTSSLRAAGIDSLTVTGIGAVSRTVTLSQATFGQPVSGLVFDLKGAATPVLPGQQARVNLLWNGELITSRNLTEDARVSARFSIPAPSLRSDNDFTVELEYLPAGGDCSIVPLPGTVEFDTGSSTVTPTFGESVGPGFQRFPQALGARIPVAAAGALRESLPDLADILTGVVATSPLQYTLELTDAADLVDETGVATGLSPQQAAVLSAPLPTDTQGSNFPAGQQTQYAALQAYQAHD
ncbi:MAG: cellulose biosynthesis cyclic di-GMP-binding regulatory protein BcsB, partial [Candidatus Nanopelagicales bacterium]|nr:cellulose biosynthesis cyclic di-GMP-binding regulatory protein BcsB [Candidatus Nanopelagicales bacterium]